MVTMSQKSSVPQAAKSVSQALMSDTAATIKAAGGEWLIRSNKFTKLDGNPPERLSVIKFDSIEKAQAFENTPAQKEVNAIREKTTNSLSFIVEGYAN
jgi:uncharacterized protein (DUF1330 family)